MSAIVERARARSMWKRIGLTVIRELDAMAAAFERRWPVFAFILADVYLLAAALYGLRAFWFDELFTSYLSRLPSLSDIWVAEKQLWELNPPLFYIITRLFERIFGYGELATRSPAILGFGIMCLCIGWFVSRNGNIISAFAAAAVPLSSPAFDYSSEARPYGMVLGFAGIAAVSWQAAVRNEQRRVSVLALAISLAAALLCHVYAALLLVPFALAEIWRYRQRRVIDWPVLVAIIVPSIALLPYVQLVHTIKTVHISAGFAPDWSSPSTAYGRLLPPLFWPMIVAVLLWGTRRPHGSARSAQSEDWALAAGFTLIPILSILLSATATKVFYDRYALAGAIGISLLTGLLLATRASRATALLFFSFLSVTFVGTWITFFHQALTPPRVLSKAGWVPITLGSLDPDLPIVITSPLVYLEYDHYLDPKIAKRLYFLTDVALEERYAGTNMFSKPLPFAERWFPLRSHVRNYQQFLDANTHFYIVSLLPDRRAGDPWVTDKAVDDGVQLSYRGQLPTMYEGVAFVFEARRPGAAAVAAKRSSQSP